MADNEMYSDKITRGSRTYFFDIKKSKKGDFYLTIAESKKGPSGFEHHRLMVFGEDLPDFAAAFNVSLKKYNLLNIGGKQRNLRRLSE